MAEQNDAMNEGLNVPESQREFTKTFGKLGSFTIRIPLPLQKTTIISNTARALGGVNRSSITDEDYEYTRMLVTLNSVMVKNPEWWKGAESCPHEDLLDKLWKFYLDSEIKFSEYLKKNFSLE